MSHSKPRSMSYSSTDSQFSSTNSMYSYASTASTSQTLPDPDPGYQAPMPAGLPCEFVGYHDCESVFGFDDAQSWIDHIITEHLENRLPSKVSCWFCDKKKFEATRTSDRRKNFVDRMKHIRDHIRYEGKTVDQIRPDYHMLDHIYSARLIPEHSYHAWRRYAEVYQGNWIIPYDKVPGDLEVKESRKGQQYTDPHKDERHYRRQQKKQGKK